MIIDEFFRPLFADLERLISSKPQDQHPEPADIEQRIEQRLAGDLEDFLYDEDLVKVVQHVLSCPVCLEQAARWQEEQTARKRKPSWPWELPERINAFGDLMSSRAAIYAPTLYTAVVVLLALVGVFIDHWLGAPGAILANSGSGGGPPPIPQ